MPEAYRHADALRLEVSTVEVQHLAAVGTVSGVALLLAAARNGEGTGRLRIESSGVQLSWQAPGSATFGDKVNCAADGAYLLEDGEDSDKWIRVHVYADHLPEDTEEAKVYLRQVYSGGASDDDVTAAEASAGDVATYTITMENVSAVGLSALKVWLHADTDDIDISDDGAAWVSPTTEGTALDFPDLAAGATDVLHLRRTIGAASASDAGVIDKLHFSFLGGV